MEWRRVKNIIIVMLLLVNGCLLLLVGTRRSETLRYEQSALEGTIQVLKENGIEVADEVVFQRAGFQPGTAERDFSLEGQVASALLGETVEGVNRGGGLYTYSSSHGEINFRTGGEMTALLNDISYWYTSDPLSHAEELMARVGVENQLVGNRLSGDGGQLIYLQMQDGKPLFSCRIVFVYEHGRLSGITGNLLSMTEPAMENRDVLTIPTVLMHFLDDVLRSGDVCSAILAVEPGYLLNQSFMETIRLSPVWYISTNTADYYVDGITGALTRIVDVN